MCCGCGSDLAGSALVSGVLGAVAGDEVMPPGGCLLVPGGLVPGLVAGPPPARSASAQAGLPVSRG
jgi:hypothetical protein